jgi:hypothetical protein
MINTPSNHALRAPVRSLQDACVSLFRGTRLRLGGTEARYRRSSEASVAHDAVVTQWAQTDWADTSFEPRNS